MLSLLLGRALGAPDRLDVPWRTRAAQLACHATESSNTSIQEVRRALLQRWIAGSGKDTTELPGIEDFAELVLDLARHSSTGHFGDNKVFISHVWRAYRDQSLSPPISDKEFKELLIKAYKAKDPASSRRSTAIDGRD